VISLVETKYPSMVFGTRIPQSDRITIRAQLNVPIAVSGYAADRVYEERMAAAAGEFYDRLTKPRTVKPG
jgi:hypothetical protein